jgi:CubicO group peptidase (beta-lactamase class C family)
MRFFTFTLLLFSGAATFAAVVENTKRMDEVVSAQVETGRFMGSVLVARDDRIVFERSAGWANLEWNIPNAADTKFRVGSVTKQFTAACILLLAERGKLQLADPVGRHLPEAPEAWSKITLQHLLHHTSGLPSLTRTSEFAALTGKSATPRETVARVRDRPLEFKPGERYAYSNLGYIVLGDVIERVSGRSYDAFVRENIFVPLGMNESGYDSNSAVIPRRAAGYTPGVKGLVNADFIDMRVPHGAGALYSSTHDLLRWEQALFGGRILSPASLQTLTTPGPGNYACGLVVRTARGRKVIEHGGAIDGFVSHLAYYPDARLTVIVLCNLAGPAASDLAQQLEAAAFGDPVTLPKPRIAIELPLAKLERYVGTYVLAPRVQNTIALIDGQLTTQLTGQSAFPIFAESETKFFLKAVDAEVEFFSGTDGKVTHLVQYEAGREQEAPRLP